MFCEAVKLKAARINGEKTPSVSRTTRLYLAHDEVLDPADVGYRVSARYKDDCGNRAWCPTLQLRVMLLL